MSNNKILGIYKEISLLVLGLRDFLRGGSQLLIFADETLRLLPHGFLRFLQPLLQVCDPPVQRGQVRIRLSDLHRRRGRHVPGRAAQDAEDKSSGRVSSLSSTITNDHLLWVVSDGSRLNDAELSLSLSMRDATAATRLTLVFFRKSPRL